MTLDARVRCTCLRDGRAKPHPFPERLAVDESCEPILKGNPSDHDCEIHDRWFAESCEHGGYIRAEFLGNTTRIAHLRDFLRGLQGNPGPRFPILLTKVIYNGTHTGDWISSKQAAELLKEVDTVLHSQEILADSEKDFFFAMKRLCEASVETGNPIAF
jgi:hypothetical protein